MKKILQIILCARMLYEWELREFYIVNQKSIATFS